MEPVSDEGMKASERHRDVIVSRCDRKLYRLRHRTDVDLSVPRWRRNQISSCGREGDELAVRIGRWINCTTGNAIGRIARAILRHQRGLFGSDTTTDGKGPSDEYLIGWCS